MAGIKGVGFVFIALASAAGCSSMPRDYRGQRLQAYTQDAQYFSEKGGEDVFLYVQARRWPGNVGSADAELSQCHALFDLIAAQIASGTGQTAFLPSPSERASRDEGSYCSVEGRFGLEGLVAARQ